MIGIISKIIRSGYVLLRGSFDQEKFCKLRGIIIKWVTFEKNVAFCGARDRVRVGISRLSERGLKECSHTSWVVQNIRCENYS